MNTRLKPYHIPGFAALLFVIASFFSTKKTLGIHLSDTYFVITIPLIYWSFSLLLIFLWIAYKFSKRFLYSRTLSWIHIVATILLMIWILSICLLQGLSNDDLPRRYSDSNEWETFNSFQYFNHYIVISVTVLLLVQVIYVVNLVCGIIRART